MVSCMRAYGWQCRCCGGSQEAPAWRILDVRERPDVSAQLGSGLAFVVCPACGSKAPVEDPMLLIRPGNELPLLLAIASSELAEPSPPSSQELAREALAALGGVAEDIVGPMLPLARQLLPLVLTRDVTVDAADPDSAHREVSDFDATLAGLYSAFLQVVRDGDASTLANLVGSPPRFS